MMKSCRECFNLIAKVPTKRKCCIQTAKMIWCQSTAYCKAGHLMDEKGRVKIFKNVLTKTGIIDKKAYEFADICTDYNG